MIIEDVQMYYLAMPQIRDIGDGSQDALVVRVAANGLTGWGECEASPLVSIANWVCPMSHSACKGVRDVVLGRRIDSPDDIITLGDEVRAMGLDIPQTEHTLSGIEIALWDLLGKRREQPVYQLLGYTRAYPKTPYASQLFGETPEQTLHKAKRSRERGFLAAKFGWGVYGRTTVEADEEHVAAAREGLGQDGILLIDAGTVWGDNVSLAAQRLPALERHNVLWFEEPFVGEATHAYAQLAANCKTVQLAGGEGASSYLAARNLIEFGKIRFIQIDTGRIGGIGPAKQVADYAQTKQVTFVNHTFTSHLALSASLAPFAGIEADTICEYPVEASPLATNLTTNQLDVCDGVVRPLDAPGLGVEVDETTIRKYCVDVEIRVQGKTLFRSPVL